MKTTVLLALMLLLTAPAARALEPTAVPDFTALSPSGAAVESGALVAEAEARGPAADRWVLLYVPLRWGGWPELLGALERIGQRSSERIAVVVGDAAPEDLQGFAARAAKAPGLQWLADSGEGVRQVLPATALPVAFGARGWAFEWAHPLGGKAPAELASMLGAWVGR